MLLQSLMPRVIYHFKGSVEGDHELHITPAHLASCNVVTHWWVTVCKAIQKCSYKRQINDFIKFLQIFRIFAGVCKFAHSQ